MNEIRPRRRAERIILGTKLAGLMIEHLGIIEAPLIREGTGACLPGPTY